MYFIPKEVACKIEKPVYVLCFISAICMILQVYPFAWAGLCHIGTMLCGEKLCSVHGSWHIAWLIPANGLGNWFSAHHLTGFPSYTLIGLFLPMLYGSWRFTLYHWLMGPMLATALTHDYNEMPAVWCLLSIALLLIVIKTPLRQMLFVSRWPGWHWLGYKASRSTKAES